jgi:hypothetical protein
MNTRMMPTLLVLLLAAPFVWAAEGKATDQENTILALVLAQTPSKGEYIVVEPKTERMASMVDAEKKDITEHLQTNGIVIKDVTEHLQANGIVMSEMSYLLDRLSARNKEAVRMTLKSSAKDGYVIDYDGKYAKYFDGKGGGWERWHKENPQAYGSTSVSLPVYDSKTGLVLVYSGTQYDWEGGEGWIILYKYEKGQLKEINRAMIWVS